MYVIVMGKKINVRTIINASIAKCLLGNTSGALPHASLITGLCRQAGVQWSLDEPIQAPMAVIDHATIQRYKVWDRGVSHPRGGGFIVGQPTQGEDDEPMDIPEQAVDPFSLGLPSNYHAFIQALHRRLDRKTTE